MRCGRHRFYPDDAYVVAKYCTFCAASILLRAKEKMSEKVRYRKRTKESRRTKKPTASAYSYLDTAPLLQPSPGLTKVKDSKKGKEKKKEDTNHSLKIFIVVDNTT
jgi:hypothetical protein